MKPNSSFHKRLKNILSTNWVKDPNNYIVKLSTKYENTLWQIFSIYKIPTTDDYLQTKFLDNNHYYRFINMLKTRSIKDFNVILNESDKIITT